MIAGKKLVLMSSQNRIVYVKMQKRAEGGIVRDHSQLFYIEPNCIEHHRTHSAAT